MGGLARSGLHAAPLEPGDLLLLDPQDAQTAELPRERRLELGWQLHESGSAFTIWNAAGRPIFLGGATRRHGEYAALWALFARERARVPLALTRAVAAYVRSRPEKRVDATASAANPGACGWLRLIGLEEEVRMRGAMPDGTDMVVFVRPSLPTKVLA